MDEEFLYEERVTSSRTTAVFVLLTLLSSLIYLNRRRSEKSDKLSALSLFFSLFFFIYTINYRILIIRLLASSFSLQFGLSSWRVPLENIDFIKIDDLPLLQRIGGAGVHFMLVRHRYRASFNFLEYPRLVIGFKEKVGPVQDLSFSTRHPDEWITLLSKVLDAHQAAQRPT